MLAPWCCLSPASVVRVRTYNQRDLIRRFPCYHPRLVSDHHQLSECVRIVDVILSEATVSCRSLLAYSSWSLWGLFIDYHNLDMCFTDCHSNRDVRTIFVLNKMSQFSINWFPIIHHQTNIYYIHELLHVPIINYRLWIPPCGRRCFPISTIDCVDPGHMYSQDLFLYCWWDTFPLFE
jgi:hypothetical protein